MSKGGPSGTTNSTQTTQPWGPQQPYLQGLFANANTLYNTATPQYFPRSTVSPETGNQQKGLWDIAAAARSQNGPNGLPQTSAQSNQAIDSGKYLYQNPAYGVFGNLAGANSPQAQALNKDLGYGYAATGTEANQLRNTLGYGANAVGTEANQLRPFASGAMSAANNPYTNALSKSVLSQVVPSIESQFIQGGGLSSPGAAYATSQGATAALAPTLFARQQQEEQNQMSAAQQLAATRLAQEQAGMGAAGQLAGSRLAQEGQGIGAAGQLANTQTQAGTGLSNAFSSGMQNMLGGLALSPGTESNLFTPGQNLFSAGGAQQQLNQQQLNGDVARWNYNQTLPFNALNQYIGEITGNYGGTTNLDQPFFQPSTLSQVGQGLGALGAAGSAASGLSMGIPALMALFSDRRLKADIERVGKLDNGLPVYSFRYKGEPEDMRRIGLMAQEVEKEHPDAVMTAPGFFGSLSGFKMVDYAKAVT